MLDTTESIVRVFDYGINTKWNIRSRQTGIDHYTDRETIFCTREPVDLHRLHFEHGTATNEINTYLVGGYLGNSLYTRLGRNTHNMCPDCEKLLMVYELGE